MDLATNMLTKIWILPAIMAGSFLVILLVGKRLPERGRAMIGILSVAACFVLAMLSAFGWTQLVDNDDAEVVACGNARYQAPLVAGMADHGEKDDRGEKDDHGEEAVAAVRAPLVVGESAAALPYAPAAEEGKGEYHSTPPVLCAWTWFESGPTDTAAVGAAAAAHGDDDAHGDEVVSSSPGLFEFGFLADGLTVMMLLTVTFISLLVHIYSMEYLRGDVRHTHYYAFLSLFTAAMLFYVSSSNTLQMLMGWELVGLCSFGLIGHWWEDKNNSDAALKAFLTNRVGDVGLIIGVVITFFAAGAVSFNVLHLNQYALSDGANQTLLLIGALCLFAGVTSKSGQFPLHTWLPDAMAGPTPVSALIHAATMVVAGVYLIARLYAVFFEGLNIQFGSVNYVAIIGGITVLGGALLAFVQQDLKKVLAYSTISQLGYMVMALGVGAWTAGVFHLFTHAFFKACLFLGAGSVAHACHHTFDMREMGGLKKHMKTTYVTFTIATLALIGLFPLAGFWSKDEILAGAAQGQDQSYTLMFVFGVLGAICTAAYMTRAWWLTFQGEYRGHAHPHESPKVMTIPLIALCVGAVTFGFFNLPAAFTFLPENLRLRFEHYVEPTFAFPEQISHPEFDVRIALLTTVLAIISMAAAYQYYGVGKSPFMGLSQRQPFAWFYDLLVNKYYLDVLYTDIIVRHTKGALARASYWANMRIIDPVVVGAGVGARVVGAFAYRYIDQGAVDRVVNASGTASDESGQLLRRIQTGKVQQYAAMLFGGAILFAFFLVLFV